MEERAYRHHQNLKQLILKLDDIIYDYIYMKLLSASMTSIDYPRPWYHVISLLYLNSAGEERRLRGSPCLQRPVPRQLQRSLCDLVLQLKWTQLCARLQWPTVPKCAKFTWANIIPQWQYIVFTHWKGCHSLVLVVHYCPLLSTAPKGSWQGLHQQWPGRLGRFHQVSLCSHLPTGVLR